MFTREYDIPIACAKTPIALQSLERWCKHDQDWLQGCSAWITKKDPKYALLHIDMVADTLILFLWFYH